MLKSKSEKAALVLAAVSLLLFFIPELFQVQVPPFKIGSVLCLFTIALLAFLAAKRREKLILGGVLLFFVLLFASFVFFGRGF